MRSPLILLSAVGLSLGLSTVLAHPRFPTAGSSSSGGLVRKSVPIPIDHPSLRSEAVSRAALLSRDSSAGDEDFEEVIEEDDDGEFLGSRDVVMARATSTSSYATSYYFDDSSVKTACKRWRCKCVNYVPTNTALTFTSVSCTNADSSNDDSSGEALAYCLWTSSTTGKVQSVNQHIASAASFTSCDS